MPPQKALYQFDNWPFGSTKIRPTDRKATTSGIFDCIKRVAADWIFATKRADERKVSNEKSIDRFNGWSCDRDRPCAIGADTRRFPDPEGFDEGMESSANN